MADHAKSISSGYNRNMKTVADLRLTGAMEADGAEHEGASSVSIPSASNADLPCLRRKWTTGSRIKETGSCSGISPIGKRYVNHAMTKRQRKKMGDGGGGKNIYHSNARAGVQRPANFRFIPTGGQNRVWPVKK
jgi:hypothetical protein